MLRLGLVFTVVLAMSPSAARAASCKSCPSGNALSVEKLDYRLKNGLRVVLMPIAGMPTVAVAVFYGAGANDDPSGQAGLAHLTAHMMFEGSKNVAAHSGLVAEAGGEAGGRSHRDRTTFYEEIPAGATERVLFAEADRMRQPSFGVDSFARLQQKLQAEILRERGEPYVPAELTLDMLVRGPVEGRPEMGTLEDLMTLKPEDVRAFWSMNYGPGNAVLAVAGAFDEKQVRGWIAKYFGVIPARKKEEPSRALGATVPQEKPERVRDPLAPAPMLLLGYPAPAPRSADWYAANLLAMTLAGSPAFAPANAAGRLQSSIDLAALTGASILELRFSLPVGGDLAKARASLDGALDKVRREGIPEQALAAAKSRIEAGFAEMLSTNLGRATELAEFALAWNDPRGCLSESERYQKVTPEDIVRVAARLLDPKERTVVEVLTAVTPPPAVQSADKPVARPAAQQAGGAR